MPNTVQAPSFAPIQLPQLGRAASNLGDVPATSDSAALVALLNNQWPQISKGSRPTLARAEAAWLVKLADHPNADKAVWQALVDKLGSIYAAPSTRTAGLDKLLVELNTRIAAQSSYTGGGTSTQPQNPTGPGTPAVTVLTGGPLSPTGAAVPLFPQRFTGPAKFEGEISIDPSLLAGKFRGVSADKFGTTTVELPTGGTYNVRDMHYVLNDQGDVGMRFVPVADHQDITLKDGTTVPGHQVMDNFLRKAMGLQANERLFSLIAYMHPEENKGGLKELATTFLKTEGGQTHLGAYIGNGRTTNSPEGYHNNVWKVDGYPANVLMVSLDGVPQATLNENGFIADAVLNKGVQFPPDYKKDVYRTVDLATTLQFYHDWIRDAAYLKNDSTWHTYCAEHKTIVTNVMLNVPHNEKAFKEIWGDTDGAQLFAECKAKFKAATGEEMKETDFEPLWKKDGITNPTQEKKVGKGLAWAPETTADLVCDFVESYASFRDVGSAATASIVFGFKDTAVDRMGITEQAFFELALPIVNRIIVADAMCSAAGNAAMLEGFIKKTQGTLYVALGGNVQDLAPTGTPNPAIMGLVEKCFVGVKAQAAALAQQQSVSKDDAWRWLQAEMRPDLEKAREQAVANPNSDVQFYSPPAAPYRVATGIHESNKFVHVKVLCTAIDINNAKFN